MKRIISSLLDEQLSPNAVGGQTRKTNEVHQRWLWLWPSPASLTPEAVKTVDRSAEA
ncbi:hypothetical protein [Microcoleus sp. bin38.metabat.b11b12b14.051]|uniref:hypothetical protein n=1 Tax=Microcoleus sp. bin38.metabat.b11b12b14.051 TaxID=2742709 RepID=UPI0025D1D48A|nr:hypothetical protein [Microcoleus sp. bin38.metabat.b11b12b14.051]